MTISPVTTETLRDLRLTEAEWQTLTILCDLETDPVACGMTKPERKREWMRVNKSTLDMLILAGLVRRGGIHHATHTEWLDSCFSTEAGKRFAGEINMIFDWDTFTFSDLSSKKIKKD